MVSEKKTSCPYFSARNSVAGNGCANFMGAWHFLFFLLESPHAYKIPRVRGVMGFLEGGGGSANVIFMGVGIFSRHGFFHMPPPRPRPAMVVGTCMSLG